MSKWYKISEKESLETLKSERKGLSSEEAKSRLEKYGPNEIIEKKKNPWWKVFLEQFKSILVAVLILAGIISAVFGEFFDAAAILGIVILNAILGFVQNYRAERAIAALKKIAGQKVQVYRDGSVYTIESKNIVPGDIVLLKTGDKVPADCRIIELMNLKTNEAVLTGESIPVEKSLGIIKQDVEISEQYNMLFSSTNIVYGNCTAIVVETGMKTEFGKIAGLLDIEESATPLQKNLGVLGRQLGIIVCIASIIFFVFGYIQNKPLLEIFLTSIALGVAAIPEGLPLVVTITLTVSIVHMAHKNALVRKMHAVETLGSTTVIASDKTGTLTMNEMTVRKIYVDDKIIEVTGDGYSKEGKFLIDGKVIDIHGKEAGKDHVDGINLLLKTGMLCNDSIVDKEIIGDPTEAALIISGMKAGLPDLRNNRLAELPFDSSRKMMSVLYDNNIYTKGALENVLERCSKIYVNGKIRHIEKQDKIKIMKINQDFARSALRVLAFAHTTKSKSKSKTKNKITVEDENNLIFIGLQAMTDSPRPEAKAAIAKCRSAGIKVLMITGDHKDTAIAVARELGILNNHESSVITGSELNEMSENDFQKSVEKIRVYARVSTEHKARIIDALKKNNHVVAMTGDGINDAPALKKSDIGIAMGITGTDVTKEASHMVLVDDNFATIVTAVEDGRGIYDNIRKFVMYLIGTNLAELVLVFLSTLLLGELILLPVQLLWINILTDGLPALALGVEKSEKDIMKRKPRDPKENIFDRKTMHFTLFVTAIVSIIVLAVFFYTLNAHGIEKARAVAFTTLVVAELFVAMNMRSFSPLHRIGFFTNRKLIIAILISFILQLAVVYIPLFNPIFGTTPLAAIEWATILAGCTMIFVIVEFAKNAVWTRSR